MFTWRTSLGWVVAVALSLVLYLYVSQSPYILALALALGAYLARVTTFQKGLVFGGLASIPLALYLLLAGLAPADSDEAAVVAKFLLVIAFGGLFCGAMVWLINSVKKEETLG